MGSEVTRVVALGASNLSLGIQTAVATARSAWGGEVEVFAAAGYGRSFGAPRTIAGRTLPGILRSGLWNELERKSRAPTRALIMDVGNDIPYGVSSTQILAWVEEAADRLLAYTQDVIIVDLPTDSVRLVSQAKFLFFRTLFFPPSRVSRDEVFTRLDEVSRGLVRLAADRRARFVPVRPEWYAIDPIHFRRAAWQTAWREILLGQGAAAVPTPFSSLEWARLHTLPPEQRWFFGREQRTLQSGRRLRRGGRLWLY